MEASSISNNNNSLNSNNLSNPLVESGISCETCRKRRVRCSRQLPQCSWCQKSNISCVYPKLTRKRQTRQKFDNMSKLEFNAKGSDKLISSNNSGSCGSQIQKSYNCNNNNDILKLVSSTFSGNNFTFKIIPSLSFKNQPDYMNMNMNMKNIATSKSTSTIRFEPHLMLQLLSQITTNDPRIENEVDWFLDKIKLGIFGGSIKAHIKLNNEWIKELFNPSFRMLALDNYFTYFHPWITYFSKRLFYKNLDLIDPCLIHVLLFVGYQYTPNLHQELLKYLEHQAKIQIIKNFNNSSLKNCQALFIYSYSMLFRGLAKQSLPYFNQACRISSILGIHLNIPGLRRDYKEERLLIRSMGICQDQHLTGALFLPPYFAFMIPTVSPLNPLSQVVEEGSGIVNNLDLLEAECICLIRLLFDKYWMPTTNLMAKFYLKHDLISIKLTLDKLRLFCNHLNNLFDICLVNSCNEFLILSSKYNSPEYLPIIQKYVWFFTCMYHQWILLIHSQQLPKFNQKSGEVDTYTKRCLRATKSIFNIIKFNPISTMTMYYHYLTAISFFYVKLYLNSGNNEIFKREIVGELGEVYSLFLKFKKEFSFSNDSFDALSEMLKVLKIEF